jgi:hypothetical protein
MTHLVQQKAGELGGARALKELDEDAARLTRDAWGDRWRLERQLRSRVQKFTWQ